MGLKNGLIAVGLVGVGIGAGKLIDKGIEKFKGWWTARKERKEQEAQEKLFEQNPQKVFETEPVNKI